MKSNYFLMQIISDSKRAYFKEFNEIHWIQF